MNIKILGTGCSKCQELEKTVREVVQELQVDATVQKVNDMGKILEYPILITPGLVIDEELVIAGKVPARADVVKFIMNAIDKKEKESSG